MGLFGNSHGRCDERIAALERQVATLEKLVRTAQSEVSEVAERAYRHLKRAEQRERRALDDGPTAVANQEPGSAAEVARPETPLLPFGPPITGARARILARRSRERRILPVDDSPNGVHP
jgi:hypothetical protein